MSSITKTKTGKTREEAGLGLNVKQAELMETGEILLGCGKTYVELSGLIYFFSMGHR